MRCLIRVNDFESGAIESRRLVKSIKNSEVPVLIFSTYPKAKTLDELCTALSNHPNVEIIINWDDKKGKKLDFLSELSFAKTLRFQLAYDLEDFSFLSAFTKLEELYLSETKNSKADISYIAQLSKLRKLSVCGPKSGIDAIGACLALERVKFENLNLKNLTFFKEHFNLRSLHIIAGSIENFDALNTIRLSHLELYNVRKLSELKFVSELVHLEYLQLHKIKEIKRLPDFSKLRKLRRIALNQMKGLFDFTPLLTAHVLEDLIMEESSHLDPDNLRVLTKHPTLKNGRIALVLKKKNEILDAMLPLKRESNPFTYADGTIDYW